MAEWSKAIEIRGKGPSLVLLIYFKRQFSWKVKDINYDEKGYKYAY